MWIIQSIEDPEQVWSNTHGWVDGCCNEYETFSAEERANLNLPIGGAWVEVPQ